MKTLTRNAIMIVLGFVVSLGACGDGESSGVATIVKGWKAAGLEPTKLEAGDGTKLGATKCHTGKVSGIYVQLCAYAKEKAATDAKGKGLKSIGSRTGISLSRGTWLLVAVDKDKVDPSGRILNKIAKVFWKK